MAIHLLKEIPKILFWDFKTFLFLSIWAIIIVIIMVINWLFWDSHRSLYRTKPLILSFHFASHSRRTSGWHMLFHQKHKLDPIDLDTRTRILRRLLTVQMIPMNTIKPFKLNFWSVLFISTEPFTPSIRTNNRLLFTHYSFIWDILSNS